MSLMATWAEREREREREREKRSERERHRACLHCSLLYAMAVTGGGEEERERPVRAADETSQQPIRVLFSLDQTQKNWADPVVLRRNPTLDSDANLVACRLARNSRRLLRRLRRQSATNRPRILAVEIALYWLDSMYVISTDKLCKWCPIVS